jgi:hypothetical protein
MLPEDLDAFRATSCDPDDEQIDFSRILTAFEIEQYGSPLRPA